MHTHTHIHTYIHTHTHTHKDTHTIGLGSHLELRQLTRKLCIVTAATFTLAKNLLQEHVHLQASDLEPELLHQVAHERYFQGQLPELS